MAGRRKSVMERVRRNSVQRNMAIIDEERPRRGSIHSNSSETNRKSSIIKELLGVVEEPRHSRLNNRDNTYATGDPTDHTLDDHSDTEDFDQLMTHRGPRRKSYLPSETNTLWTTSSCWKKFTACIIGTNTLLIITEAFFIQIQLAAFDYVELAFTGFYVLELLACIIEQGPIRFLCNEDWWNVFDLFVTVLCVLDYCLVSNESSGAATTRLFRLFRILRVFRALRFMNELDYVIIQIARSTVKLGALASVSLIVSSIIATHMLWDCPDQYVADMFADLSKSMWTMFKIMTLDNWSQIVEQVIKVKPEMTFFFVAFIFTTAISLISLAPAMFIDISLRKMEHEDLVEQERHRHMIRKNKKRLLLTLFRLTDADQSGSLSVDELRNVLTKENIVEELQEAGFTSNDDLRDVRLGLFEMWEEHLHRKDSDEIQISMEEFTDGIMRMHEDISQAVLWRSCTATRLMLRDFAAVVLDELGDLREAIIDPRFSISDADEGTESQDSTNTRETRMGGERRHSSKRGLIPKEFAARVGTGNKLPSLWSSNKDGGVERISGRSNAPVLNLSPIARGQGSLTQNKEKELGGSLVSEDIAFGPQTSISSSVIDFDARIASSSIKRPERSSSFPRPQVTHRQSSKLGDKMTFNKTFTSFSNIMPGRASMDRATVTGFGGSGITSPRFNRQSSKAGHSPSNPSKKPSPVPSETEEGLSSPREEPKGSGDESSARQALLFDSNAGARNLLGSRTRLGV